MNTAASFHESGHIVVAALRGLPIDGASIIQAGSRFGATWLERSFGSVEPGDLLLMVCSGPAAEARSAGGRVRYDQNDREILYELAAVVAGAEPGSLAAAKMLERYEAWARALVALEEKRIRKVAAALVRHRELTGEQLQDLLWVKKE